LRRKKDGLENGQWFQGSGNYISVGLLRTNSGNLSTKSFALQIDLVNNSIHGSLVLYDRKFDTSSLKDFYLELSKSMVEVKPRLLWERKLDSSNGLTSIINDFWNFYPSFQKLIEKHKIEKDQLIDHDDFQKSLSKVERYKQLLKNNENRSKMNPKFWIYAPGEQAKMWPELYAENEMAIAWDEIGDLAKYNSKAEIENALNDGSNPNKRKTNDSLACYEFSSEIEIGDVIIAKKGTKEYIGWGIVTSDYFYDETKSSYKSRRRVSWKNQGEWIDTNGKIVLKTLTDITKYPEYVDRLSKLLNIQLMNESKRTSPLNQILYGPPGTGKTYSTIDKVLDILEPNNSFNRDEKKAKYNQLITDNRAFFTTFHQSMSYEEFIEGIKPHTINDQIRYEVTNGILKDIVEQCFEDMKALKALSASGTTEMSFKEKFLEFSKAIQQGKIILNTRSGIPVQLSKTSNAGNLQLNSGEDTRDYVISMKRLEKLVTAFPNPKVIKNIHEEIRSVIGGCNSSLYFSALDAFVSFAKKLTDSVQENGKEISLSEIKLTPEEIDSLPPYFLIIDEINRGNVSAIFGELITLIEEDKRFGRANQLFVKLPYSREEFILPPNLYIIGTMNTADRSVEALDTALRRRFSFVEMLPDATKLKDKTIEGIDLALLLNTLNERIEVLVDRDHTIGHAFFMNLETVSDLRSAFANKIIPLLQEYFYGNYRKMEMVIGSAFFHITEANKVKFAVQSDDFDADGTVYHIKNISDTDGMSDASFIDALNQLIQGA
jgi:5-methylcytosine-specific restriction protein B